MVVVGGWRGGQMVTGCSRWIVALWMGVTSMGTAHAGDTEPAQARSADRTGAGAMVWQGFEHRWQNVIHRMGDTGNYIRQMSLKFDQADEEMDLRAAEYFMFLKGCDGDKGSVRTFYTGFANEGVGVTAGVWDVFFTDETDPQRSDKLASTAREQIVTVPFDNAPHAYGEHEVVDVVMGGFEVVLTDPRTGEPGSVSPTGLGVEIGTCRLAEDPTQLACPLTIELTREETPDWFKRTPKSMTYHFRIHWVAIRAEEGTLATRQRRFSVDDRSLMLGPAQLEDGIVGEPGWAGALVGIKGFSLAIYSDKARDGRMLKAYDFHVEQGPYHPDTGTQDVFVNLGVQIGAGGKKAAYSASLQTVLLQFQGETYLGVQGALTESEVCAKGGLGGLVVNCGGHPRDSGKTAIEQALVR